MSRPVSTLPDKVPLLRRRAGIVSDVRKFFHDAGYWEAETPYVVRTPCEEVHLRPFRTEYVDAYGHTTPLWLHTSPEFAMKKLLAAGSGPIFQFARVWRNHEGSDTHLPEFTMLEWYRPGATLSDLMDETERLLRTILPPVLHRGEDIIDLSRFERLRVQDAFARYVGADVLATAGNAAALARQAGIALRADETWDDLFFRLMLDRIEPHLGRPHPIFLTHWPAPQAALARRDPDDPRAALRFELYCGGLELANAFEELTDPQEQRDRFIADRACRHALYGGPDWPLDEEFLAALPDLPPCSGIALGFDRLVMLASGAGRIDQVTIDQVVPADDWRSEATKPVMPV